MQSFDRPGPDNLTVMSLQTPVWTVLERLHGLAPFLLVERGRDCVHHCSPFDRVSHSGASRKHVSLCFFTLAENLKNVNWRLQTKSSTNY